MIPAGWAGLGFTSGRRTYRGNKLVGGVTNSDHLHGTAADFTAPLNVLQARFPGHRILDEGDHRHVSGLSDVPYYGRQGIAGLVNGVDTTAPKGTPMLQPRKRNLGAMSRPVNGVDPLAPMPPMTTPPMMPQAPQPDFAAMSQPVAGFDPLAPKPGGHKFNLAAAAGILGDAFAAYGGQRGVFAPIMAQQRQDEAEDNRFREKLAAEQAIALQKAKAAALEPPAEVKLGNYIMGLPPEQRAQVLQGLDAVRPVTVTGPMGTSIVPRSTGGATTKRIGDTDYYLVNGEWYDNPEGR